MLIAPVPTGQLLQNVRPPHRESAASGNIHIPTIVLPLGEAGKGRDQVGATKYGPSQERCRVTNSHYSDEILQLENQLQAALEKPKPKQP